MLTIRISFEKRGEAAYISLLDLQRVFHRILKRSGLPVYYTQGFNPHIYLSFNCPLSLGQESLCESCEVKTADENADLTAWQATLQPYMPHGIRILRVAPVQRKSTLTLLPLGAMSALSWRSVCSATSPCLWATPRFVTLLPCMPATGWSIPAGLRRLATPL